MLVQKLIVIQLVVTLSACVKPRSSLLFSQEFASEPYHEADESNLHPDYLFFKVMVGMVVVVVVVVIIIIIVVTTATTTTTTTTTITAADAAAATTTTTNCHCRHNCDHCHCDLVVMML